MLQVIDNTLMAPFNRIPGKEDLIQFCEWLFMIGVDVVELPVSIYEQMGSLPAGRYILNVPCEEEAEKYPGFYRYACHQEMKKESSILEIQINDVREIIRLKNYQDRKEVRIKGLDDLMCHSYEKIMSEIVNFLPNTIIVLCPENTYGCAGAIALQWLTGHGKNITSSFAGAMNNAATEEVIMALRLAIRHKPNRNLKVLPELTGLYEKLTDQTIANKKPIIGKNIFRVEAGIHADGLNKNPVTYEAYAPDSVGQKSELVIGKHSGTRSIKIKMTQLGIPVPKEEIVERILNLVKHICTKHNKSLNDEEFKQLLMEVAAYERRKIHC